MMKRNEFSKTTGKKSGFTLKAFKMAILLLVLGAFCCFVYACANRTTEKAAPENVQVSPSPAMSQAAPEPAPAGYYYTCPMHPQIVEDKPGQCPICGMNLVKKEGTPPGAASPGKNSGTDNTGEGMNMKTTGGDEASPDGEK